MELQTKRLFLRTVTEADVAVVRDFGKDEFATDEEALAWIRWVKIKNEEGRLIVNFYIWLANTDQCIGRVYIHSKPELDGEVEIGYGISEEYRNKGYVTEAAQAVIRYAFEEARQDMLAAIVKPENTASQCVINKLGFSKHGVRMLPDENDVLSKFDYFRLYRDEYRLF